MVPPRCTPPRTPRIPMENSGLSIPCARIMAGNSQQQRRQQVKRREARGSDLTRTICDKRPSATSNGKTDKPWPRAASMHLKTQYACKQWNISPPPEVAATRVHAGRHSQYIQAQSTLMDACKRRDACLGHSLKRHSVRWKGSTTNTVEAPRYYTQTQRNSKQRINDVHVLLLSIALFTTSSIRN